VTRDELEFAISQYLDGALAEAEVSALEERLATDAEARAMLAEYRRLEIVLKAAPRPALDWEALGDRITQAVAGQEPPAQSYRLHWVKTVSVLAVAATVLVAVGFGIRLLQPGPTDRPNGQFAGTHPPRQPIVIEVVDRPIQGAEPVQVTLVDQPVPAENRPVLVRYQEDLVSRPSQVIIARSGQPYQDNSGPLP